MTTLTSSDGGAEVINARRTESLDAPNILKLVQPSTEALFGRVNVVNLIEKAVLAVTLSNDRDDLLGHAAFYDYPNLPKVDPTQWEGWLNKYYDCSQCQPLNTLFLHYFVAKPEYSHGCAREIIRTMFNAVPELHYCFLVVPTGVFPDSALADIFHQVDHKKDVKAPDNCAMFICYRHEHVPVLHVRAARVEDHDDLVPIFNRQSDVLQQTYGNYFLAELIEAQDEGIKCIVAEVDGTAVGFMSLSSDVNVGLLNECFELGPFHGLKKPHPDDILDVHIPKTPAPSPALEPDEERPPSDRSDKSNSSNSKSGNGDGVVDQAKGKGGQAADRPGSSKSVASKTGSRPSSKSSGKPAEPVKTKPRLSDAQLGDSQASVLSDHSDAESVKSAASLHQSNEHTSPGAQVPLSREVTITKTPKPQTPQASVPKRFVPQYKGAASAFCIQLFCIDEKYEMRSADFLPKAFELFPDCDFGVISVPHLVPEIPLLQQFVRVTPRCPSTLAQELYVFSRPGLIRNFVIRPLCTKDMSAVEKLVSSLELSENLLADLKQFNKARRDADGTAIQAFVAECAGQIVGVGVIRSEENVEWIRSHYNVEDFIYFNHHQREEHGHLHHYALNPIFKHLSKHFIQEILRQGRKTCLYYPLHPPYVKEEVLQKHSLVTALHEMVPVRARRQIAYPLDSLGGNAPSERVLKEEDPYALNHINRKLILEPKVTINARIIVVGASDVGISFLETFAFCPHLRFNNLTLVCPHGLPGELPPDPLRDQMMASSLCYSQAEYAQMALRSWVNVVYGKMTGIDRKKKHLIVNNGTVVPYDHLILCAGAQYQVAAPTEADISQLVTSNEVPNSPDRRFSGQTPSNLFTINDQYDAAVALYWAENNLLTSSGAALVYGSSLDAYCCVQALINLGVPASRIILVEPPLNYQTTCFNNSDVEKAVLETLDSIGVQVHSGYLLAQWNDGNNADVVTSASFTSNTKPLKLDCAVFFSFYKRTVDYEAFKAINDACLVYDGRLVIDANFHTNDVSIRAAGPLTKFQRSYHADQWTHANFNSKEVGIHLATVMLALFDPTLEPEPEPPQDLLKLIPMYRSPKIWCAELPGGYHYLHVAKPGLNTPLEMLMSQADYGKDLVTGKPGSSPEYFRLHINQYNSIETVTCLAKTEFSANNLVCLYGLHQRFLNNLVSRFDEGLIQDFYSYFRETWCLAIFHDRFPDFRDEVRELLITRPSADVPALEEKVRQMIEEDSSISKSQRKKFGEEFQETGSKRAVETRLLSFLSYNYYHLPMYAKPGMV